MKILGVIPARGGSKEVPRKNLLKLRGKTLVELAIESAYESQLLTRTIVSTDDNEIIKEATRVGGEIPFKRPSRFATDSASTFSVLKHAVKWLNNHENYKPDIIVILQPTTPFRRGHHIDGVIKLLLDSDADAVITIRKPNYPPHWMMKVDKKNRLSNLIPGGTKYMRRQDTPVVYQPAGMVYAFNPELLNEIDFSLPFKDTRGFVVPEHESINIDTNLDFELAKSLADKYVK